MGAGKVRFTRPRQEEYLELLREGGRRQQSARALGIDPGTVWRFLKENPDFENEMVKAEMEANEVVEDALFQAASSGNVPAIQTWLYNREPNRWRDTKNLKAELSGLDGGPILTDAVSLRRLSAKILDDPLLTEQALDLLSAVASEDADSSAGESGTPSP